MRQRLPDRRFSENTVLVHQSPNGATTNLAVTYGRDIEGNIREVFINAAKEGSEIEVIMNDAATAFSVALQSGRTPAELYKSMRRDPNGKPASLLGFVLRDMVKANG